MVSLPLFLLSNSASMFFSLGVQHHGQSSGALMGTVSCEQLPRERLPSSLQLQAADFCPYMSAGWHARRTKHM